MDISTILLALIRLVFGIAWVGIAFFFVLFFEATIHATGSAGEPAMARFSLAGCPMSMGFSSIAMVAAGLLIYLDDSSGFPAGWISTPAGIALAAGTIAGVLAFFLGLVIQSPCALQIRALGIRIQADGEALTSAQVHELSRLRERFFKASRWGTVLIILSALAMAIALELTWF